MYNFRSFPFPSSCRTHPPYPRSTPNLLEVHRLNEPASDGLGRVRPRKRKRIVPAERAVLSRLARIHSRGEPEVTRAARGLAVVAQRKLHVSHGVLQAAKAILDAGSLFDSVTAARDTPVLKAHGAAWEEGPGVGAPLVVVGDLAVAVEEGGEGLLVLEALEVALEVGDDGGGVGHSAGGGSGRVMSDRVM